MSLPVEFDFALLKIGDGEVSEAFTTVCGIQDVTINQAANLQDRFVRDCAAPGTPPNRFSKVTGKQWDISGTGLTSAADEAALQAALGVAGNWKVEGYDHDGTSTGALIGTYSGSAILSAKNLSINIDADSGQELSLVGQGALTYAAAS